MVSSLLLGTFGIVMLGLGYILADIFLLKKHKAILFYPNGKIRVVGARRHPSGSAYSFLSFKDMSTEHIFSKGSKDITMWVMEKGIPVPLFIDYKSQNFKFPDIMAQQYMVTVRKNQQDKTKSSFLEKHFDTITGLVVIALAFVIYMYTIKTAGTIDVGGIQPLIEQFVNTQNQTATQISDLSEILKNSRIPN